MVDIYNEHGHLVVRRGTVVTPKLIWSLTARGLYGDPMAAILDRDKGDKGQERAGKNAGVNC